MNYCTVIFLSLLISVPSFSADAESGSGQCYAYITEMVRSSSFPFSKWELAPDKINIDIDDDNDDDISARLFFDTDGTGTIGWVKYNKNSNKLYNTSAELDKPVELAFNNEFSKAWKYCLDGQPVYHVTTAGKHYFYRLVGDVYMKTNIFVIAGDYVQISQPGSDYIKVKYQPKQGSAVNGWLKVEGLTKVDFISTW